MAASNHPSPLDSDLASHPHISPVAYDGEGINVPYLLPASSCAFVELPHYLVRGPPGDIEASSHATEHDAGRDTISTQAGTASVCCLSTYSNQTKQPNNQTTKLQLQLLNKTSQMSSLFDRGMTAAVFCCLFCGCFSSSSASRFRLTADTFFPPGRSFPPTVQLA